MCDGGGRERCAGYIKSRASPLYVKSRYLGARTLLALAPAARRSDIVLARGAVLTTATTPVKCTSHVRTVATTTALLVTSIATRIDLDTSDAVVFGTETRPPTPLRTHTLTQTTLV